MEFNLDKINSEISKIFSQPNALRSVIVLVILVVVAYWLSKFIALAIIKVAQLISVRSDNTTSTDRQIKLRRVETYLSVSIAIIRALVVGIVAFFGWTILLPGVGTGAAAIGASTFFAVLAGGTIGMILRDLTAGAAMIVENWFDVGDYIRVEPFGDVTGVVERITLRSTKLRSLNGEVVWLHNQFIQGVKVTPGGLRTMAVDVFANSESVGKSLIEKAIETMPIGTIKLIKKPLITRTEQWGEKLWYFTVVGTTAPGREWLMEDYFIQSLHELDDSRSGPKTFIRPPIARYSDPAAERSFKRAIRLNQK